MCELTGISALVVIVIILIGPGEVVWGAWWILSFIARRVFGSTRFTVTRCGECGATLRYLSKPECPKCSVPLRFCRWCGYNLGSTYGNCPGCGSEPPDTD